jgi:quercetin dioxygenase-like cupin family protein
MTKLCSLLALASLAAGIAPGQAAQTPPPPAIPAVPDKVTVFPASQVNEFFAKSGTLIPDTPGEHYMIMTVRRDKPGLAEWHHKYADILYVVEGTATLVTGGHILEGKTTAPDEIRGTKIEGGHTQKLVKGDVVVIPKDTPHQFVEVSNPLLYLTVKSR